MLESVLIFPLAMLSACATLVDGSSQSVTVSTNPPGASCTLDRVGAIPATPGSVRVDKSKNDLSVTCAKDGYQTATVAHPPSVGAATFGNIIAGGVIGVVVDAASGANYTYPDDIRIDLAANPAPVLPPVALQAPPGGRDAPIRLMPVAAQSDQLLPIKPTKISATPGQYPRWPRAALPAAGDRSTAGPGAVLRVLSGVGVQGSNVAPQPGVPRVRQAFRTSLVSGGLDTQNPASSECAPLRWCAMRFTTYPARRPLKGQTAAWFSATARRSFLRTAVGNSLSRAASADTRVFADTKSSSRRLMAMTGPYHSK